MILLTFLHLHAVGSHTYTLAHNSLKSLNSNFLFICTINHWIGDSISGFGGGKGGGEDIQGAGHPEFEI